MAKHARLSWAIQGEIRLYEPSRDLWSGGQLQYMHPRKYTNADRTPVSLYPTAHSSELPRQRNNHRLSNGDPKKRTTSIPVTRKRDVQESLKETNAEEPRDISRKKMAEKMAT